ncbi:MAG: hypothetical protein ACYCDN_07690 [Schaalia turicensis]
MDPFSLAHEHVSAFRVHVDDVLLSQGEAELRDLALLRDAVDEAIASRIHELVTFEGLSWSAVATAIASSPASLRKLYGRASNE